MNKEQKIIKLTKKNNNNKASNKAMEQKNRYDPRRKPLAAGKNL